jgi:hypothetical protein
MSRRRYHKYNGNIESTAIDSYLFEKWIILEIKRLEDIISIQEKYRDRAIDVATENTRERFAAETAEKFVRQQDYKERQLYIDNELKERISEKTYDGRHKELQAETARIAAIQTTKVGEDEFRNYKERVVQLAEALEKAHGEIEALDKAKRQTFTDKLGMILVTAVLTAIVVSLAGAFLSHIWPKV